MSSPELDQAALLADLAAVAPKRGGHSCHTAAAIAGLPGHVADIVNAALDNPLYSSTDLARVLNKHQAVPLTTGNLARHRRRGQPNGCKCPREADAIGQMRGETA